MRLVNLCIENFRAITTLELTELGDAVVLAGPNGCGKSCVLDAIRLLKSAYGSYQQDEWQTWLGEFQINLNREPRELMTLFQNPKKELRISGSFVLSTDERNYLGSNLASLVENRAWQVTNPSHPMLPNNSGRQALSGSQRINRKRVAEYVAESLPQIRQALEEERQVASIVLPPLGDPRVQSNLLLELIFSTYEPQVLGIVDYHGPHRNYNRERVGNINLTIESSDERLKQSALYNYANKYANLKTEMASAYIRHLLARQTDPTAAFDDSLTSTLKELFTTFFPGKEFIGPRPTVDGRLLFPVRLANGAEHDIDELSSGEKEVLYGYLRLQNAAPKHSIIMIDEPELHLNPRLVSGL